MNPLHIATAGILTKNPLSIGTDGFLFLSGTSQVVEVSGIGYISVSAVGELTIVTAEGEVIIYKKRPGPYFYAEIDGRSIAINILSTETHSDTAGSVNTGISGPFEVNRKRS